MSVFLQVILTNLHVKHTRPILTFNRKVTLRKLKQRMYRLTIFYVAVFRVNRFRVLENGRGFAQHYKGDSFLRSMSPIETPPNSGLFSSKMLLVFSLTTRATLLLPFVEHWLNSDITFITKFLMVPILAPPPTENASLLLGFWDESRSQAFVWPEPTHANNHVGIGSIIEQHDDGYCITKHLQNSYLFKRKDGTDRTDGRPRVVDKETTTPVNTLVQYLPQNTTTDGDICQRRKDGVALVFAQRVQTDDGISQRFQNASLQNTDVSPNRKFSLGPCHQSDSKSDNSDNVPRQH